MANTNDIREEFEKKFPAPEKSEIKWCENKDAYFSKIEMWKPFAKGRTDFYHGYRIAMQSQQAQGENAKPVAWEFQHEETGLIDFVDPQQVEWGFEKNNPRWQKIGPVYRHPPTPAAVPEEATPEMEQAAEQYWNERRFKGLTNDPRTWAGVYRAMVAAAKRARRTENEKVQKN